MPKTDAVAITNFVNRLQFNVVMITPDTDKKCHVNSQPKL